MNTTMHNRGGTGHRSSGREVDPRTWITRGRRAAHALRSTELVDAVMLIVVLVGGVVASTWRESTLVTALVVVALGALSVAASIDRRALRLPNVLTLPALGLGLAAGAGANTLGAAFVGAGLVAAPFLVVHLVDPAGMGFGDVKCAAAVGAVSGAVAPTIGPLLAVIVVLVLVVALRAVGADGPRALGPAIVVGAALALVPAAVLADDEPPPFCCSPPVVPTP